MGLGNPYLLRPGQGNRASGASLPPGWHNTLIYVTPSGAEETSSVIEASQWIEGHMPLQPEPATSPPTPARRSSRLTSAHHALPFRKQFRNGNFNGCPSSPTSTGTLFQSPRHFNGCDRHDWAYPGRGIGSTRPKFPVRQQAPHLEYRLGVPQ